MAELYTARTLRVALIDILGADAGRYQTPQGQIPAVRIYDQKLPPDWSMATDSTGLEVIIPLNPDVLPSTANAHQKIMLHRWEVRLILHSLKQRIAEVLHCLVERFQAQGLEVSFIRIPPSDLSSEQYVVSIEQRVLIRH